jgi:hypothetical protein
MDIKTAESLIKVLQESKKYVTENLEAQISLGIDIAISIIKEEIHKEKQTIISKG